MHVRHLAYRTAFRCYTSLFLFLVAQLLLPAMCAYTGWRSNRDVDFDGASDSTTLKYRWDVAPFAFFLLIVDYTDALIHSKKQMENIR